MKEQILQTLRDLRTYALTKNVEASFLYHEEDSYLMRFANSAISLNTNEHLIRLEIEAYDGRKRASYELITALDKMEEMQRGVDIAAEMVRHAQPLHYQPSLPAFRADFADESGFDPFLASLSSAERLDYFNQATKGMETPDIQLSGIFSCGANIIAQISTRSEHTQYFATSDAQVSIVLSSTARKWEVTAEQSAYTKADLDPFAMRRDLAFLLDRYQAGPFLQLPLGSYDIVFGPYATGELVGVMNWIAISGGSQKRGFSFLNPEQIGQRVFSDQFSLTDDPRRADTFPFRRDFMGIPREPFPIFADGVFKAFTWSQDDADEFGAQPTGHNVTHKSLVLNGGSLDVSTLEELAALPRERDLLYIPYLHYMNIVNPSKGLITASSRFGALLLKADGSVAVPYNVRITRSLPELFGDKLAWLSKGTTVNNTSASYGSRNPTAIVVPTFVRVNDLEISQSNAA